MHQALAAKYLESFESANFGDFAEEWLSKAETGAKGTEDDYQTVLAALKCDCEHFVTAEETNPCSS